MNGTKVIKIANIPSNTNATKPCSILPVQYGVPNLLLYTPLRIGLYITMKTAIRKMAATILRVLLELQIYRRCNG
jgi:hypothetical protein